MSDKPSYSFRTAVRRTEERQGLPGERPRELLLVTGMHRSGMAPLMHIIQMLGAEIGPNANEAQRGGFEHPDFSLLNEEILMDAGRAWNDFRPLPPDWLGQPGVRAFRDRMFDVFARDFMSSDLIAVKDPRLARTLPLWLELAETLPAEVKVIVMIRQPSEVIASLQSTDGVSPTLGALLWLRYVIEAEYNSRGLPRVFVTYDQLLGDWAKVLGQAGQALGCEWPNDPKQIKDRVRAYLSPEQRHQRAGNLTDLAVERTAFYTSVYNLFEKASRDVSFPLHDEMDKIRQMVDIGVQIYEPFVAEQEKELNALRALFHQRSPQLAPLLTELTVLRRQLQAKEAQMRSTGIGTGAPAIERQPGMAPLGIGTAAEDGPSVDSQLAELNRAMKTISAGLATQAKMLKTLAAGQPAKRGFFGRLFGG